MNNVVSYSSFKKSSEYGIEEGLMKLCEYGKPRLASQGNGEWYCAIEMYVQGKGVDFKIASDFGCKSPQASISECIERLQKALKDLGLN